MKRTALIAVLLGSLVVPGVAFAQNGAGQERANAARACKALKASMGEALFRQTYGTADSNHRNAMGKCVSRWMKERNAARQSARTACEAERNDANFAATHGGKSFQEFYGGGKGRGAAFRNCVATKMGATLTTTRRETVNAARQCKTERSTMGETAFRTEYGTNASDRNAFGKCVSKKTNA